MKNEKNENKEIIKIILLGDCSTGKTSLINVFEGLEFTENMISTIGCQYCSKEKKINKQTYIINVWDTAGQEKFQSLNSLFIKGSNIVIFVYDVTCRKSFINLSDFWVDYVEKLIGKDIIRGIVGNKIDLFEQMEVNKKEGEKYANEIEAFFKETSAKEDPKGFLDFLNELIEEYVAKYNNSSQNQNSSFQIKNLKKEKHKEKSGEKCC